jgi:YVTN family beta-propeller protein
MKRWLLFALALDGMGGCSKPTSAPSPSPPTAPAKSAAEAATTKGAPAPVHGDASMPLVLVADVELPGKPARFDYQDLDAARGRLVIAHMNDASVVVVRATDGSLIKELRGIPTPRGVIVSGDRIFVTSSPSKLVIVDANTLDEIARVDTGAGPDGVAWDPEHRVVGVSDQHDGALSLLKDAGSGARTQVKLGKETGNVVYDPTRHVFWITVVTNVGGAPGRLVAVDPIAAQTTRSIALPHCAGAHGLRLHPNGQSALVACEDDARVLRVGLEGAATVTEATCGNDPDVLAIDPALGWLYVASESGDLTVFDLERDGLVVVGRQRPGDASHSVAVDPATHHVFFPLEKGSAGKPVLRIMKPTGT